MAFHLDKMVSNSSDSQIAFMTTKEREMFPLKTAKDKFGNELCPVNGMPHRGPGCYENDKKTGMSYELQKKICSTKGYSLGARTGPRLAKESAFQTPCPTEYQKNLNELKIFEISKQPFEVGADRFPVYKRNIIHVVPGAGTYEHEIHLNRKVQWHQSFGGSPVFLPTVTLRSTIDRNTEKLYSTKGEKKYQRKLAYLKLYY